ncbi:isocitrate lyase/phosphoenolpyruvate mutase family protein [Pendulispora brunnea]|uniref:Isocitrate lyase/phosphoenolpyruvate mutase family protein n=1 Tax=Pendulispora brunnea TaxID=2905690 RepID=A0ABZ2KLD0_9BACT
MTNAIATFRSLHAPGEMLVLPNAWDSASAALFAASGARATATTSSGLAWSLGYPDGEHVPVALLADVVRRMVRTVDIPVSVDLERGYGRTPREVAETVARILDTGAVGFNLEDGSGDPGAFAEHLHAAREAAQRAGVDAFINARTDIVLHGKHPAEQHVSECLARAKVYAAAGADGFFVPGLRTPEHIEAISKGTPLPLNVFSGPGLADVATLRQLGVRRLSVGGRLTEVAYEAARRACVELLDSGTYSSFFPAEITYAKMNAFFAGKN